MPVSVLFAGECLLDLDDLDLLVGESVLDVLEIALELTLGLRQLAVVPLQYLDPLLLVELTRPHVLIASLD